MLTVKTLIINLQKLIDEKHISADNEICVCTYDEENNIAKFMDITNISKHSNSEHLLVTLNIDLKNATDLKMPENYISHNAEKQNDQPK